MDADTIAELMAVFRPALQALAEGPKGRAEAAFARLEIDVARWAVHHEVTPEDLDRLTTALRDNEALRQVLASSFGAADRRRTRPDGS